MLVVEVVSVDMSDRVKESFCPDNNRCFFSLLRDFTFSCWSGTY